jgi:hypothetical protein
MTETTTDSAAALREAWEAGFGWEAYLEDEVVEHRALWHAVWERASVPAALLERAHALGGGWRLLVISEDWCGDAVNTVPVIARLAEALPGVELRVVKRDEHPALMDRFLTAGTRSIPLVRRLLARGALGPPPRRAAGVDPGREGARRAPRGGHLPRRAALVCPRPRREHAPRAAGGDGARLSGAFLLRLT